MQVASGEVVAIVGPSGSGKSTLLNVVSGLVPVTTGSVVVDDVRVDQLDSAARCDLRRDRIGFVFQAFHLLPHLTALENAAIGAEVRGIHRREAQVKAAAALAEVGLAHRQHHRPAELSGGEQQRVALARTLTASPSLLLVDEPTGNLDPAATDLVIALLRHLHELTNATVLVATHAPTVAALASRRIAIGQGGVEGPVNPAPAADRQ